MPAQGLAVLASRNGLEEVATMNRRRSARTTIAAAAMLLYGSFLIVPSLAFIVQFQRGELTGENAGFGLIIAWPAVGIGALYVALAGLTFAGRLRRAPVVIGLLVSLLLTLFFQWSGALMFGSAALAAGLVALAVFEGAPARIWRWANYEGEDA
jgi:hypothetical protein